MKINLLLLASLFVSVCTLASSDEIIDSGSNCLFRDEAGRKCFNLHIFSSPLHNFTDAINYCNEHFNSNLPSLMTPGEQLELEKNLEVQELFFWINIRGHIQYNDIKNRIEFVEGSSHKIFNTSKWDISSADLSIHDTDYYCVQAVGSDEDIFEGSGHHSLDTSSDPDFDTTLDTKYIVKTTITWTLKPCSDYAYNVLCERPIDLAPTTMNPLKLTEDDANYNTNYGNDLTNKTGLDLNGTELKVNENNSLIDYANENIKIETEGDDASLETILALINLSHNLGNVLFSISILVLIITTSLCFLSMGIYLIRRNRRSFVPIIKRDGFPLVYVRPNEHVPGLVDDPFVIRL